MNITATSTHPAYAPVATAPAATTTAPVSDPAELRQRMIADANMFTLLFALECAQHDAAMLEGSSRVEEQAEQIRDKIAEIKEELRLAREAAESQGFWGSIVGVAKAVGIAAAATAAVASMVVSGGVSAPAALALGGVLISVAGTEVAAELGASKEVLLALQLGATALSGAGAAMQLLGTAASAGAAAAGTAERVGTVASATQGGAAVVQGYSGYREGDAKADGLEHDANAEALRAEQRRHQRYQQQVLEVLGAINDSLSAAKEYLGEAQDEHAEGSRALVARQA
jgi:hypothetical protein